MKKMLLRLLLLLLIPIAYVLFVVIHGTLNDYQPEAVISLKAEQTSTKTEIDTDTLSFAIWNLGYGGLGAKSDFFYDDGYFFTAGGKTIFPEKPQVESYVSGIVSFFKAYSADFYLLQEVDYESKRSHYINQVQRIGANLPSYATYFAPNYKVKRVPIPIAEFWRVYGKTHSGLATFSKYQPSSSTRYQLPGSFDWPTRIFQLDRCALVQTFKVGEKELLLVNVHNSAYDSDGSLKKQQMAFLQQFLKEAYNQDKYVIVGGDWNQCPPNIAFDQFMPNDTDGYSQTNIAADFMPAGWHWAYDETTPTNRKNRTVYKPGETFVTLIDFFLLSPNVELLEVKGINQDFAYSDHQPVMMQVSLR